MAMPRRFSDVYKNLFPRKWDILSDLPSSGEEFFVAKTAYFAGYSEGFADGKSAAEKEKSGENRE